MILVLVMTLLRPPAYDFVWTPRRACRKAVKKLGQAMEKRHALGAAIRTLANLQQCRNVGKESECYSPEFRGNSSLLL